MTKNRPIPNSSATQRRPSPLKSLKHLKILKFIRPTSVNEYYPHNSKQKRIPLLQLSRNLPCINLLVKNPRKRIPGIFQSL